MSWASTYAKLMFHDDMDMVKYAAFTLDDIASRAILLNVRLHDFCSNYGLQDADKIQKEVAERLCEIDEHIRTNCHTKEERDDALRQQFYATGFASPFSEDYDFVSDIYNEPSYLASTMLDRSLLAYDTSFYLNYAYRLQSWLEEGAIPERFISRVGMKLYSPDAVMDNLPQCWKLLENESGVDRAAVAISVALQTAKQSLLFGKVFQMPSNMLSDMRKEDLLTDTGAELIANVMKRVEAVKETLGEDADKLYFSRALSEQFALDAVRAEMVAMTALPDAPDKEFEAMPLLLQRTENNIGITMESKSLADTITLKSAFRESDTNSRAFSYQANGYSYVPSSIQKEDGDVTGFTCTVKCYQFGKGITEGELRVTLEEDKSPAVLMRSDIEAGQLDIPVTPKAADIEKV